MADKLSKFNIKGTLADVIDAEARASIAELTEDVSSAVSTAQDAKSAADDALNGLTTKQDSSDAWKCGYITRTFNNITIATGSTYDFAFDIPDNVTNAIPVYARSTDNNRLLLPTGLFTDATKFHNYMYNAGSSISNATIIIQMVCMFK